VAVRCRVDRARSRQLERFLDRKIVCNSQMGARDTRRHCELDSAGERLLDAAIERLHLSARAYGRILKIARTIADLDGRDRILAAHVAESIQYRALDRSA
jgi:magnesium chelatase family protein